MQNIYCIKYYIIIWIIIIDALTLAVFDVAVGWSGANFNHSMYRNVSCCGHMFNLQTKNCSNHSCQIDAVE